MREIVIKDYDPHWAGKFEEEKTRLLNVIGKWVLEIHHIGSTAVPGLGAKPVIDILIGVQVLGDADSHCIVPIAGLGYEYVKKYEESIPYRRYFNKKNAQEEHTHHIHLVEKDGEFWARHLLFRDYLRSHRETAQQYELLKRSLTPRFTDGNDYASAKTAFIKEVEAKAMEWRADKT